MLPAGGDGRPRSCPTGALKAKRELSRGGADPPFTDTHSGWASQAAVGSAWGLQDHYPEPSVPPALGGCNLRLC